MVNATNPTAGVIIIGNEILSGKTQDLNLQFIGLKLGELGVRLERAVVIPDVEATIIATVNDYRTQYDYVFTTGGIGPTHDDITSACVAKAFGVELVEDPEAVSRLQRNYQHGELSPARRKMACVPEGASLVDNPISQAPGFRIGNVFVLAGIPSIAPGHVRRCSPATGRGSADRIAQRRRLLGRERDCQATRRHRCAIPNRRYRLLSFFRNKRFGATVVARGTDATAVTQVVDEVFDLMQELGGEPERP